MRPQRDDPLVDLLDVLLDKGVIAQVDVIITVADIPLVGLQLRAALAGMETMTKYGFFRDWDIDFRRRRRDYEMNHSLEYRPGESSTRPGDRIGSPRPQAPATARRPGDTDSGSRPRPPAGGSERDRPDGSGDRRARPDGVESDRNRPDGVESVRTRPNGRPEQTRPDSSLDRTRSTDDDSESAESDRD
ncbi:gas vesicle protein GvpJ [Haloferacaceae archaeon DSL9]